VNSLMTKSDYLGALTDCLNIWATVKSGRSTMGFCESHEIIGETKQVGDGCSSSRKPLLEPPSNVILIKHSGVDLDNPCLHQTLIRALFIPLYSFPSSIRRCPLARQSWNQLWPIIETSVQIRQRKRVLKWSESYVLASRNKVVMTNASENGDQQPLGPDRGNDEQQFPLMTRQIQESQQGPTRVWVSDECLRLLKQLEHSMPTRTAGPQEMSRWMVMLRQALLDPYATTSLKYATRLLRIIARFHSISMLHRKWLVDWKILSDGPETARGTAVFRIVQDCLIPSLTGVTEECNRFVISKAFHALGQLGYRYRVDILQASFLLYVWRSSSRLDARAWANALWSFGKLDDSGGANWILALSAASTISGHSSEVLFAKFEAELCTHVLDNANLHELSNIVWSIYRIFCIPMKSSFFLAVQCRLRSLLESGNFDTTLPKMDSSDQVHPAYEDLLESSSRGLDQKTGIRTKKENPISQALCTILWSLAGIRWRAQQLCAFSTDESRALLPDSDEVELVQPDSEWYIDMNVGPEQLDIHDESRGDGRANGWNTENAIISGERNDERGEYLFVKHARATLESMDASVTYKESWWQLWNEYFNTLSSSQLSLHGVSCVLWAHARLDGRKPLEGILQKCFAVIIHSCSALSANSTVSWEDKNDALQESAQFEMKTKEISVFMWSLASLGVTPPDYVITVVTEFVVRSGSGFSLTSLTLLLWSFAKLKISPSSSLLRIWSDQLEKRWAKLSPQALSIGLWSMASLEIQPSADFLRAIGAAMVQVCDLCTPQQLSMIVWSMAKMKHPLSNQFVRAYSRAMGRYIERSPESVSSQELMNMLWAFATMRVRPPSKELQTLLSAFESSNFRFSPQELAICLWAVARMHSLEFPLVPRDLATQRAMVALKASLYVEGSGFQLPSTSSFSDSPLGPEEETEQVSSSALVLPPLSNLGLLATTRDTNSASSEDTNDPKGATSTGSDQTRLIINPAEIRLISDASALALRTSANAEDPVMLKKAISRFLDNWTRRFVDERASQQNRPTWKGPEISLTLWSLARLKSISYPSDLLWRKLESMTIHTMKELDDVSLCTLLRSYVSLGKQPAWDVLGAWQQRLENTLNTMSPSLLADLLKSLVKLSLAPDEKWLMEWCAIFERRSRSSSLQTLEDALWSLAALQYTPSPRFLAAWAEAFKTAMENNRIQIADLKKDTLWAIQSFNLGKLISTKWGPKYSSQRRRSKRN